MKPSIVILVLLIGAFVLGDIAAVMYVDATNQHWPDLPGIFLLGLTFGQLMLLSAWFVFVRWNIAMRVLIVIAAVFGLSLVVALSTRGANAIGHWFAILLVAFCTAAVPTTVTRCFRWQINREGKSQSATGMTDWQFSIWGLLSGTTAVAIVMGTAKQVEMPLLVVGEAVVFFSCFALTGLSVLFAGLGIRLPQLAATIAIFVVSVICPLAGMFVGVSGLPQRENPLHWALFGFCYGATISIAVLALRIAGYRLSRAQPAIPETEDTDAKDDALVDVMPSTKLPIKIQFPEVPDVAAPHPSLSIHLPSEDD